MSADPDYDEIERLIDEDPIALGQRCRDAEGERDRVRRLVADMLPLVDEHHRRTCPFRYDEGWVCSAGKVLGRARTELGL